MKLRKANPRLLCYLSAAAFALSACSQNATKLKPAVAPVADHQPDEIPSSGTPSRLFHYSRKGVRQVKIGDTRRAKRVQYEYASLWERLFDNYALPDVRNQAVERELSWFINHPSYLQRAQQRAEPFLYNIVQQIERQGVPGELALLPVVESAFQAQAVSPARAAGIWQFIPATGRRYGLTQNHAYDGRRDVYASTKAAIKYLKKLNRQFNGDWLLAVAAYNCGEGAVEKAIQRNAYNGLPTDFWSLDLPQETRAYVPRLLAVSRLFADADRFGLDLRYMPNEAVYKPVKISHQLDLALAADAADMSLDEFRALNPGFKNTFVDPVEPVRLFVPAHKSKTFKKEIARLASAQSDLLRKEFERTRNMADRIIPVATVPAPIDLRDRGGQSVKLQADEPLLASTSRPRPAPPPAEASPSPVVSDRTETYQAADESPSVSPNPFQPPAVSSIDDALEYTPTEQNHTTSRKTRRYAAPTRSGHHRHYAQKLSVQARKAERREPVRGHKPSVSYKYSAARPEHDSAPRSRSVTSSRAVNTTAAKSKDLRGSATKLASNSHLRVAQPDRSKSQSRAAAVATPRASGKNIDSRKNERILTAKAETVRNPKARR